MGIGEIIFRAGLAYAALSIARNRGRDPIIWGALTAFLIFPIIFLLFLPPVRKMGTPNSQKPRQEEPFSGQTVDVKPLSKEEEHVGAYTSFASIQWYLLDSERKSVGPFPFAAMQQKFWEGELNEETFVWTPEWKDWKKVSSIPGLLSSLSR